MTNYEIIYTAIIAALPSIVSVLGVVISVAKLLSQFTTLQKKCDHEDTIDVLRQQVVSMHKDNEELREQLKQLTEVISRVNTDEIM